MQPQLYHCFIHEQPPPPGGEPAGIWQGSFPNLNQALLALLGEVLDKLLAGTVIKPYCEVQSIRSGEGQRICWTEPFPDGTLRLQLAPGLAPGVKALLATAHYKAGQHFDPANPTVLAHLLDNHIRSVPRNSFFFMQDLAYSCARLQNVDRFPFFVEALGVISNPEGQRRPLQQVDYFPDLASAERAWHAFVPFTPAGQDTRSDETLFQGARLAHAPTGIGISQVGDLTIHDHQALLPLPYQPPTTLHSQQGDAKGSLPSLKDLDYTVSIRSFYFPYDQQGRLAEPSTDVTVNYHLAEPGEALKQLLSIDVQRMHARQTQADNANHCHLHAGLYRRSDQQVAAMIGWGRDPVQIDGLSPGQLSADTVYLTVDTKLLPDISQNGFPIELQDDQPVTLAQLIDNRLVPNAIGLFLQKELLIAADQPFQDNRLTNDTAPYVVQYQYAGTLEDGRNTERQVPAASLPVALASTIHEPMQSFNRLQNSPPHEPYLKFIRVIENARGIVVAQRHLPEGAPPDQVVLTVATGHVSSNDMQRLQAIYQPLVTVSTAQELASKFPEKGRSLQTMGNRQLRTDTSGHGPAL